MVEDTKVVNAESSGEEEPAEHGKDIPQRRHRTKKPAEKRVDPVNPDMEERVVAVARVAKVVKGGRRFSFSAIIVIGDKKGKVGWGLGKAKEVPEAIRKGTQDARKNMITVPIDRGTIPHTIVGKFGAGKILLLPAAEGTGVKAAGACRSILELAGIKNVLTKSLRSTNPHNVVKATFLALKSLRSLEQVATARGKEMKSIRLK